MIEPTNPVDPAVALTTFAVVVTVLLAIFWPRTGGLARYSRARARTDRARIEDALKHLHHATAGGATGSPEHLAGALEVPRDLALKILEGLQDEGLARLDPDGIRLTEEGKAYALRVLRSHRLVERYLADRTGVLPEDWHDLADAREHEMSVEEVERLAARMGQPRFDPHGDPIPTADGELPPPTGVPLASLSDGQAATVIHVEDEPRAAYDRLRGEGFGLGRELVVRLATPTTIEVDLEGRRVDLPRGIALGVTVAPHDERPRGPARTLADLEIGAAGRVRRLTAACGGAQRRRLLDLGIVPGTEIRAELRGASGEPVAFRVRGALVALRREQASWIEVEP